MFNKPIPLKVGSCHTCGAAIYKHKGKTIYHCHCGRGLRFLQEWQSDEPSPSTTSWVMEKSTNQ